MKSIYLSRLWSNLYPRTTCCTSLSRIHQQRHSRFYPRIVGNTYKFCLPSAKGIELIELGGMIPTSVTTAVMLEGGVRSYKGLSLSNREFEVADDNDVPSCVNAGREWLGASD